MSRTYNLKVSFRGNERTFHIQTEEASPDVAYERLIKRLETIPEGVDEPRRFWEMVDDAILSAGFKKTKK